MLIVAIVLAAGESRRMGRPKQTLNVGGVPMLQRVLDMLRKTKVDRVVVVTGAHWEELRAAVKFGKEEVIHNEGYAEGMGSSLRAGIAAAGTADAVLIVLADQPSVLPDTVDALIAGYRSSEKRIVAPVYHGRRGNPVLFDRALFPKMSQVRGDVGAKAIVERNRDFLLEIPVEDDGVVTDIDEPDDLDGFRLPDGPE
ncbi:MAG: nucleotidyltransferase family protein [Nitrososphaerota archaeon]|nr:nucleotidyltransferase family protein [Nitrososphaerota archaeon]